ncbi:MAG TPA: pilus (MSHA type) biogenesis protein MshL, partial [Gammaproteobacteria bacterium]|nr:pilus (MSHA type) biogenesis protein MshL [Gammaproteobacteria bacterium]
SDDNEIILHVHPSVSEVTEEIKEFTVGTTITAPLATSTIRESDSVIRAQSGQVVVIGGLMRDSARDDSTSVPVLGDIPVMGKLFSHQRRQWTKSELVILLKPVVVEDQGWSDALRDSSKRLREMRRERP